MTPEEREKFTLLNKCTFQPGAFDKRFVRDLAHLPDYELSPKQVAYLNRIFHRYRKQIGETRHRPLCAICNGQMPPTQPPDMELAPGSYMR